MNSSSIPKTAEVLNLTILRVIRFQATELIQ